MIVSVMTSCSSCSLEALVPYLRKTSGVYNFDIFLLRDRDLRDIGFPTDGVISQADVLCNPDIVDKVCNWLVSLRSKHDFSIPAFATYFPNVTSSDERLRQVAVGAIANSMRIAIKLATEQRGFVKNAIVEIVGGNLVDLEDSMGQPRVVVRSRRHKRELLLKSLEEAVSLIGNSDIPYAFAVEVEPGITYALNGQSSMLKLAAEIARSPLSPHVGFNLDIGHMRINRDLGVPKFPSVNSSIVHSHISDHAWIHHDQPIGRWTDYELADAGYQPYFRSLLETTRSIERKQGSIFHNRHKELPFSGAVAIELEGSSRLSDIHDSVARVRHAVELARLRPETDSE